MKKATQPDELGHFGDYGGRFVPETLMSPLEELQKAYAEVRTNTVFHERLNNLLLNYSGRPTPLFHAERLSERIGARLYLKREDLNHTGAHKINNALGQALLAQRMGKRRIIAETGAGQHGVATATVCALLDLECVVYMGREDMRRQAPNVFRIELLGGRVIPVESGSATLKDAVNEAMRDWVTNVADTFYLLGSAVGPHPYPLMVRDFQSVIGRETREQVLSKEGRLPHVVVACVGGGSNAIGIFQPFIDDEDVCLIGVEAGGRGPGPGDNAARIGAGLPGVLHGTRSYLLQDDNGQVLPTHSVSAGLDYPLIGPEHAYLYDSGRAEYTSVTDEQALEAFHLMSRLEGIVPALESSHALAYLLEKAGTFAVETTIVLNLSGRGDKDVETVSSLQRP